MSNIKNIIFLMFFSWSIYGLEHNHTNIHTNQIARMHKILAILEIEKEKLNQESDQIVRSRMGLASIFDKYLSTKVLKDLPPDFRGIFKAMNRLADQMVCPICKQSFIEIIKNNKKIIKKERDLYEKK